MERSIRADLFGNLLCIVFGIFVIMYFSQRNVFLT